MELITIKKQQQKFNPEIGDFIFDEHNLIKDYVHYDLNLKMFPLIFFGRMNPFVTIKHIGIETNMFKKTKYCCPFSANNFYGIVPVGIETKNSQPYRHEGLERSDCDWVFDLEWQQKNIKSLLEDHDPIISAFLGHGYTEFCLPYDGSNKVVNVKIELSNGDFIIAKTFEWYNK